MKDADYLNLIKKHFTGEIDSEETQQLAQWLKQSDKHCQIFQEMDLIWKNASRKERKISDLEIEKEFGKLRGRLRKGNKL